MSISGRKVENIHNCKTKMPLYGEVVKSKNYHDSIGWLPDT